MMTTNPIPNPSSTHDSHTSIYIFLGFLGPFVGIVLVLMCCGSGSGRPWHSRRNGAVTNRWGDMRTAVVEDKEITKPELWEVLVKEKDAEKDNNWDRIKPIAATFVRTSPQEPDTYLTTETSRSRSKRLLEGSDTPGEPHSHLDSIQIVVMVATPSQRLEVYGEGRMGEYLLGVTSVSCRKRSQGRGARVQSSE